MAVCAKPIDHVLGTLLSPGSLEACLKRRGHAQPHAVSLSGNVAKHACVHIQDTTYNDRLHYSEQMLGVFFDQVLTYFPDGTSTSTTFCAFTSSFNARTSVDAIRLQIASCACKRPCSSSKTV